jgi:hypothetical protein
VKRSNVFENDKGEVWTAYTDFDWIARRHGIKNRSDQFKMASTVIAVRYRVQSQSAFPFAVRPMNAAHRYGIAAAGA